jgi:ketosteroid isomerase-like protein
MINDLVGGSKAPAAVAPAKAPAPTVLASTKPAEPPKLEPVAVAPAPAKPAVPEAKLAEPKPAPAPTSAPAKAGNPEGEITAVVDTWLAAWSKKDVKAYLAHYAQDFETPRGLSRKDWETERAQRVGKPGQIEVGRDKLTIKAEGADKATVRFRQNYHSASFKSSSGKTLVLVRRDGKWLILKEQTG